MIRTPIMVAVMIVFALPRFWGFPAEANRKNPPIANKRLAKTGTMGNRNTSRIFLMS